MMMCNLDRFSGHKYWGVSSMSATASGPDKAPRSPSEAMYPIPPNNPSSWSSYERVKAFVASHPKSLPGMLLTPDTDITVIDIDPPKDAPLSVWPMIEDIDSNRYISKLIRDIDSYTEVSSSGRGVHIFVRGNCGYNTSRPLPPTRGYTGKIEVFSRWRYIIMTGNTIHDAPIQGPTWQQRISHLIKPNQTNRQERNTPLMQPKLSTNAAPEDEPIIQTIIENFPHAWQGNYEGDGYESGSEADMAIISALCDLTSNVSQIARIWLQSPLSHRKNNKKRTPYYIYRTIEKARGCLDEFNV